MEQSILDSTKKNLGIDPSDTAFDLDVLTHINSSFLTLNQLGVGPEMGFFIEDNSTTWEDLLGGDPRLNAVKNYVFLKCKLGFDAPPTSFAIAAMEKQIQELEWRINLVADPAPPVVVIGDTNYQLPDQVFDGGEV